MLLNPKERFLRTPHAEQVGNFLGGVAFEEASDAALLQHMEELGKAQSIDDAAGRNWQREGAIRFLQILKNIAKQPEPAQEPISSVLKEVTLKS